MRAMETTSEKLFLVKDLSGRGFCTELNTEGMIEFFNYANTDEADEFIDWIDCADIGDSILSDNATKVIRIK